MSKALFMKKYNSLLFIVLISVTSSWAQSDLKKKTFNKVSIDDVETFIWGDFPDAKSYEAIPEEYQDEPAVYIKKEYFVSYKTKKGQNYYEIKNTDLIHKVIKIQEKEAIATFNKLEFRGFKDNNRNKIAIRVFKKSGEVVTYGNKDLIEDSDADGNFHKIALGNIEVGDIIDYYHFSRYSFYLTKGFRTFKPDYILLVDDYPIVHQYYEFNLVKLAYLISASSNGAPEAREEELKAGVESDLKKRVIFEDRMRDAERGEERWIYPLKVYPNIRYQMAVGKGYSEVLKASFFNKSDRVSSKRSDEQLLAMIYSHQLIATNKIGKREFKFMARYFGGKTFPSLYDEVLETYNYIRWEENSDESRKFLLFSAFLKKKNIEHDLIAYVPRWLSSLGELLSKSDLRYGIRLKLEGKDYFITDFYSKSNFSDIDKYAQGVYAYSYPIHPKAEERRIQYLEKVKIPVISSDENARLDELSAKIVGENLKINYRRSSPKNQKRTEQYYAVGSAIISLDDYPIYKKPNPYTNFDERYEKEMNIELDEDKVDGLMDTDGIKKARDRNSEIYRRHNERNTYGYVENLESGFTKNRREYLKNTIEGVFEEGKVEKLDTVRIISSGRMPGKESFQMSADFEVKDYVKKLGPNLLVSAGKLIGQQVNLEAKEREREVPVFQDYNRKYINHVEIEIPEGFAVEGIEKLKVEVDNEAGTFIAKAVIENGKLILDTEKGYKKLYDSAEGWQNLVKVLDAAYDYTQQQVLLRKQ